MDTLLKTPNWLNVLEFARHSVKGGAKWKRAVNKAKFDCKGVFDHVHSDANMSDMPPEFVKHLSFRIFMASVEAEFKYMDVMEKGKAQGRFPKPGDPNDAPWAKYQEYLTAMNMIDFGDMLALAVHLLEKDETIARLYRGRFQVALVDEFQDMNPVQMRMIVALRTRAITVVGDDDQAIYSFRGAVQAPFKYFRELMVSCGIISSTVDAILKNYILETNYRNTPQILFHANEIVQSIAQREYKLVRPTKLDGPRVVEVVRQHEASDAEQVVAQIEHLRDRENLPYSGVRILFRRFKRLWGSHTHKEIQRQLTLRGIPFEIVGGPSFLEAKAVKQVFGYLDLMLDPMNDKAFLRALSLPRRYGLGETSVTLKEIYRIQYDSRTLISLWKSAEMCLDRSAKMTRPKQELQKFLQELVDLHKFATTSSVSDLVNYVISIAREQPMIPDEDDDDEEAEAVEDAKLDRFTKDALQILASMAKQFDEAYLQDNSIKEGNGLIFLQEFVARSSLGENLSHTVKDKENQVCISTIHAAKGLESPCVFIMDADSKYLRKGELWSELEQVEAARVHHVGATRAMKYLYIYHKRIEVDELIRRHRATPKPRHCVTDFSKIVT
ncbi:P-loop containing nucleoside triphosphate hydrolase protein [Chytriomyces sp. MP71]|nr:P-loop containing nucleoside triphosphate hydrolase protein [Chytriomyces sp. MP71]